MQRTKWTDRKFGLDIPEGWLPDIIERLYGTEIRIKAMTASLNDQQLSKKNGDAWSIKEHIGHLNDLEELHEGRIDDFLARKEMLRAADMQNVKTNQANHNKKSLDQLIKEFKSNRDRFISRLQKLDDETQQFKSMHPRLKVFMRPVDMAFFTAEHDDHHLASIRELL
ncbi:MAG: DinB family protein [Bacteroidetes bacterium]|jgi:hypothetical protein|nr:DinB family protein [Bacteroidota bacterium]